MAEEALLHTTTAKWLTILIVRIFRMFGVSERFPISLASSLEERVGFILSCEVLCILFAMKLIQNSRLNSWHVRGFWMVRAFPLVRPVSAFGKFGSKHHSLSTHPAWAKRTRKTIPAFFPVKLRICGFERSPSVRKLAAPNLPPKRQSCCRCQRTTSLLFPDREWRFDFLTGTRNSSVLLERYPTKRKWWYLGIKLCLQYLSKRSICRAARWSASLWRRDHNYKLQSSRSDQKSRFWKKFIPWGGCEVWSAAIYRSYLYYFWEHGSCGRIHPTDTTASSAVEPVGLLCSRSSAVDAIFLLVVQLWLACHFTSEPFPVLSSSHDCVVVCWIETYFSNRDVHWRWGYRTDGGRQATRSATMHFGVSHCFSKNFPKIRRTWSRKIQLGRWVSLHPMFTHPYTERKEKLT